LANKKARSTTLSESFKRDYKEKDFLLTPTELEFFKTLKIVVDNNETIFAKVRQADILLPASKQNESGFWQLFNKISQRHVDFVLCDLQTSQPLTIIEINDKTHEEPNRKKKDFELQEALKHTKIRLIEIPAQTRYNPEQLRELLYPDPQPLRYPFDRHNAFTPQS